MMNKNELEAMAVSDDQLDEVSGGLGFGTVNRNVPAGTIVKERTRAFYVCKNCKRLFDIVVDAGNPIPKQMKCTCGGDLEFTGETRRAFLF